MIAVTIGVGPFYESIAQLSANRIRSLTGLATYVLGKDAVRAWVSALDVARWNLNACTILKLRLFEIFKDADDILYFDADLVYLRSWEPTIFSGSRSFVCVRDHWFQSYIQAEAKRGCIPIDRYFNFGFFIANRHRHAEPLRAALNQLGLAYREKYLLFEQTLVNKVFLDLGVPILYVDRRYNFMAWSESNESASIPAIAVHKPFRRNRLTDTDLTIELLKSLPDDVVDLGIDLDEDAAKAFRGKLMWVDLAGGGEHPIELRSDHTVGASDKARYWYVFRGTLGSTIALFSRDNIIGQYRLGQDNPRLRGSAG